MTRVPGAALKPSQDKGRQVDNPPFSGTSARGAQVGWGESQAHRRHEVRRGGPWEERRHPAQGAKLDPGFQP
jgi:hypothetical protein